MITVKRVIHKPDGDVALLLSCDHFHQLTLETWNALETRPQAGDEWSCGRCTKPERAVKFHPVVTKITDVNILATRLFELAEDGSAVLAVTPTLLHTESDGYSGRNERVIEWAVIFIPNVSGPHISRG